MRMLSSSVCLLSLVYIFLLCFYIRCFTNNYIFKTYFSQSIKNVILMLHKNAFSCINFCLFICAMLLDLCIHNLKQIYYNMHECNIYELALLLTLIGIFGPLITAL